jgi:ribosome-associated heat shock protein Hsp15
MTRRQSKPSSTKDRGREGPASVRIDKWLWAARFYKTRSLASEAVKSGKVHCDSERVKPSKELQGGEVISVRQDIWTRSVLVKALSERRGPASQAALLYDETAESIAERERLTLIKQAQPALRGRGAGRPTKRERRQIISFTQARKDD